MVKAYRDTWELGLHSYLTYMRDRLLLARDLLTPSGSVFVQISDENLHHVRELLDEVFGAENFAAIIPFSKTTGTSTNRLRVGVWLRAGDQAPRGAGVSPLSPTISPCANWAVDLEYARTGV